MGMLIDELLPLTTLVIFVGGNSGQMITEILRKSKAFADYDQSYLAGNGGIYRPVYIPYHDRQYISRLPYADKMSGVAGDICWVKNEDNRKWLRRMTEEWLTNTWDKHQLMPLNEIIDKQLLLAIPTHVTTEFAGWVFPDARKLYVTDYNSYFAVRADKEKNPDKHPPTKNGLIRFCAERSVANRAFNVKKFKVDERNMPFKRSDLITDDREMHSKTMESLMAFHNASMTDEEKETTWTFMQSYLKKQKMLGYLR